MAVSDPVADMLTKIRNASREKFERVDVRTSKIKYEVVKILKNEGYIKNFKKAGDAEQSMIRIFLKYDGDEARSLKTYGELPDTVQINAGTEMLEGEEFGDDNFDFDEDADNDSDKERDDVDDI